MTDSGPAEKTAPPAEPTPAEAPASGPAPNVVAAAKTAPAAAGSPAPAAHENPIKAVSREITDEFVNPDHPLGPFQEPHSTMIAGIEEHVGYVPGWLLGLMILAVVLAMIMWYPTSY
ncbi:MAG TPA: hypothetical protein VFJ58_22770 [Armatimonadota bacterium]|nr:hypothetical protein [Armatimonadota bacterium]